MTARCCGLRYDKPFMLILVGADGIIRNTTLTSDKQCAISNEVLSLLTFTWRESFVFLGAFEQSRKAPICLVVSVCLRVLPWFLLDGFL